MTTSTATLVHTSSRKADNALRLARVAAAGRVAVERQAAEARKAARYAHAVDIALAWVEDIRAAGAVSVGFKICDDDGKHRFRTTLADAAGVLAHHAGEDVEAWGVTASGEYVANVW
jgi:hypothetical protein